LTLSVPDEGYSRKFDFYVIVTVKFDIVMFQVKSKQKTKAMGVLDIYGFEVFEVSFFLKLNFNTKSTSIDPWY
jgi:myosin heavy subunit